MFQLARARAATLSRPLVVVGAPDGGVTAGYGCGDITVDLAPSSCPGSVRWDITKTWPIADNSVVVFCSCVLEYVSNPDVAVAEMKRVSGGEMFIVGVEPWTLTAFMYPGAKNLMLPQYR
jgi:hypothetical protein